MKMVTEVVRVTTEEERLEVITYYQEKGWEGSTTESFLTFKSYPNLCLRLGNYRGLWAENESYYRNVNLGITVLTMEQWRVSEMEVKIYEDGYLGIIV
jgi:hypothetical protein